MRYIQEIVEEIIITYPLIKNEILTRLSEFQEIRDSGNERRALKELLFCILTPQSRATSCWEAIEDMDSDDALFNGSQKKALEYLGKVRFKYKKAGYLIEARERFFTRGEMDLLSFIDDLGGSKEARKWFVDNIKGLGYKETSHFLRNIGMGSELAILDRHILRHLESSGVIDHAPVTLTPRRYLDIESAMREFSLEVGIPMDHLDLVLWYLSNGSIFK